MPTFTFQIQYIADQLSGLGNIRYSKMFGEYRVYCNEVFFALVCDDKLFVKTVNSDKKSHKYLPDNILDLVDTTKPAYPGSKNTAQIPDILVEDRDHLILICTEVLKLLA